MGGTLRARTVWLGLALLFVTFPFTVARFVPSAELPQHAAQIRLLEELWGLASATVDTSAYRVRPFAPNTLIYWPMFLLARLFTPAAAAKLTLLLIAWWVTLSLQVLAYRRKRSALSALLAGMLVFSGPLYAGLLGFLAGLPFFLLLAGRIASPWPGQARVLELAIMVCLSLLLVWSHVLWLPVVLACFAVEALHRTSRRALAFRAAGLVPTLVFLAYGYPELLTHASLPALDSGMSTVPVLRGLSFSNLVVLWFGGVQGWTEAAAAIVLLLYIPVTLLGLYGPRGFELDTRLLLLGALLSGFALFGPDTWMGTPNISVRFAPFGMMLLVLSLPPLRSALMALLFLGCAAFFSLTLSLAWYLFNQEDLTGLSASLGAAPGPTRMIEIDYRGEASTLRGRPFVHSFAYFQARYGGEGPYSLADTGRAIVTKRQTSPERYRRGIVGDGPSVQVHGDVSCFLVNGTRGQQATFKAQTGLESRVDRGFFQLYCRE